MDHYFLDTQYLDGDMETELYSSLVEGLCFTSDLGDEYIQLPNVLTK